MAVSRQLPMPPRLKPISLYPLPVEAVIAALVRIPPPPKAVKPAKAKRRARKTTKKRAKN
jgi:hypothetical protein